MFSPRNARILFGNYKFVVGKANYAHKARSLRKTKNDAGIANRKTLVDNKEDFENLSDHDFDFEADFFNVGMAYKQNIREEKQHAQHVKQCIIKQKYFKENLPNFLTWSDKEQIRHLHKTNPEEWTVERLSEGFPALPHVIAKVIKSSWVKTSHSKTINHDNSVVKNWQLFREGKMRDLSLDVLEHLQKFSDRKLPVSSSTEVSVAEEKSTESPLTTKRTEFFDIIRSYRDKCYKSEEVTKEPKRIGLENRPLKYSYVETPTHEFAKHITLDDFTHKLEKKSEKEKITPEEEYLLKNINYKQKAVPTTEENFVIEKNEAEKFKSLTEYKSFEKKVSKMVQKEVKEMDSYPERIWIPKSLYKKGFTYKLNDCYYDDDGEFLYRVPGMYKK